MTYGVWRRLLAGPFPIPLNIGANGSSRPLRPYCPHLPTARYTTRRGGLLRAGYTKSGNAGPAGPPANAPPHLPRDPPRRHRTPPPPPGPHPAKIGAQIYELYGQKQCTATLSCCLIK